MAGAIGARMPSCWETRDSSAQLSARPDSLLNSLLSRLSQYLTFTLLMKWTHCKSIQMSDFLEIGCVEITMIDKHAVNSNKCICFVTDKKATG